jgi:hypothetical protein
LHRSASLHVTPPGLLRKAIRKPKMGSHPLFIPHATYIVAALVKKHTSHLLIATHSFTVAPMRLPPVRILEPASPHHGIDMCQTLPTKNQSFVKVFPTNKNTDFPDRQMPHFVLASL